jgi:2-keto-3-deoxy-L-rhamnonate aldolase RhmA
VSLDAQHPLGSVLEGGGVAVGLMLFEFDTPAVMRIVAAAGADFALFDQEHTGWDASAIRRVLATGQGTGIYPIVRVPRADRVLVAAALDAGARGVMAPMIESGDEAELLVSAARYPPLGRRGFGLLHADQLEGGPPAAVERANRDTVVIAQIETIAGVQAAESIVAVAGIDAVWLGQFDLSLSVGRAGDFSDAEFRAASAQLIDVCARAGKPLGQLVGSRAEAQAARDAGIQVIAYCDIWLFQNALRAELDALRAETGALRAETGALRDDDAST